MTTTVSSSTSSTSSSTSGKTYGTDANGKSFIYELYKRTVINPIKPLVEEAHHLGYLDKNKTALEVQSTLTRQSTTNYFAFTFRKGEKLKLETNMNAGVRVQLYDASGIHMLADSEGTNKKMTAAYAQLTAGTLELKNTNYIIKATYSPTAYKNKTLNYELTLRSGSVFQSKYKTMAQATTIHNALMEGQDIGGFNPKTTAASVLYAAQSGEDTNIFDFLA